MGSHDRLARLHANGRIRAVCDRTGRRLRLIDIDGRRYLDGGEQPVVQHPRPSPSDDRRRRARQLDKVAHVTNLGGSNPTTIRLAKRLVDLAPPGLNHVFFSDDGATSVEVAIKMALQYWRQTKGVRTIFGEGCLRKASREK